MTASISLELIIPAPGHENRMAGRLRDERGNEHCFSSWLGLLSLLDAAHARARGAAPPVEGRARIADPQGWAGP